MYIRSDQLGSSLGAALGVFELEAIMRWRKDERDVGGEQSNEYRTRRTCFGGDTIGIGGGW